MSGTIATRFKSLIESGTPLVLDGGLGSLLISEGLPAGEAPETWVLERPDLVTEAHRQYMEAGSDIVHCCTFGANPVRLAACGMAGRCAEVNLAAVRLCREACAGGRTLVAGDIGPTGHFLPPMGGATVEEFRQAYREQARALAEAGVDCISIETMYDLREALAAVEAAVATGLPVMASMTFEARKRGFFTVVGDRLCGSLAALRDAGATAVGFNCSVTSGTMIEMVEEAAGAVEIPLVAQPNAGLPRMTAEGVVYDADPRDFAADLGRMVRTGARMVGGCCGTDARFIRAARKVVDSIISE